MIVARQAHPPVEPGSGVPRRADASPTSTTGRWTTSRSSGSSAPSTSTSACWATASFFTGGDRDIALTRSVIGGTTLTDEGFEWNLPEHDAAYYQLPDVRERRARASRRTSQAVDQADGKLDGKWRDNDIDQLLKGFDTPARTPYQQRVVEAVIKNEEFGKDDVARPAVPELQGDRLRQPRLVDEQPGDGRRRRGAGPGPQAIRDVPERAGGQGRTGSWCSPRTTRRCPTRRSSGGFQISTGADPGHDQRASSTPTATTPPIVDLDAAHAGVPRISTS